MERELIISLTGLQFRNGSRGIKDTAFVEIYDCKDLFVGNRAIYQIIIVYNTLPTILVSFPFPTPNESVYFVNHITRSLGMKQVVMV